MEKLVLIDGNSLLNRAYYATPVFTTKSGMPTNAIFGFVKLLFKILVDVKPEYIVVAFDLKAPTFRHKMFDGYKATRKGMPDDLATQVEPLKSLLSAMKVAMCSKEGLEADDIIGTLSKKFNVHSYIYTGDRDSFQLVDAKTDVYYTKRGVSDLQKLNIDNFKSEIGISPLQVIDMKALMGDKSDNIPGVAGIGEKTALNLLERFGSLDGVYENLESLSGSVKDKLSENKDSAYMSYKLATIDRECDLDVKLENCTAPKKYSGEVKELFHDFEFNSLLGLDIFEENAGVQSASVTYPEKVICKAYEDAVKLFKGVNKFSVALEEKCAHIYNGAVEAVLEVSDNLLGEGITIDAYIDVLKYIFADKHNKVIMFNCKEAMHLLKKFGIEFACDFDDVSLAKYLGEYSANTANWGLKEHCEANSLDFSYCAYVTQVLFEKYWSVFQSEKITGLYEDIEKPLLKVLFDMEDTGVKVSESMLDELTERYEAIVLDYQNKIFELCGCSFNINSPSQLGEVLYTKLGIIEVRNKKSGKYSTGAEVLEKLQDKSPVINSILKYRMYKKLCSTYLEGYRPYFDSKTKLIHTTYNQTVTATGRLSSANPNLQNIPIRENEGRELRKIFVPREGNVFIDADYSQIELRLLAHFSGCKELIDAYNNDRDIHAVTASQVFGVKLDEVTDKMRRAAKAVNFGIIYGISDFGLSQNLNISVGTAREYIEKYFASYSAVKEYMNENVAFAKANGYVSTLTGRKRYIPEISSSNFNLRQFGERAAMNMPLQGSSADIIKIAMINVYNALKKEGLKTKLILQVHDELVLDAPKDEAKRAAEILKTEMENAVKLNVPLTVDVHTGENWYDAK